mgnify:CR=1 FL=1
MSQGLQIAGMVTVSAGVAWIWPPAGVITAGVLLILLGIATAK